MDERELVKLILAKKTWPEVCTLCDRVNDCFNYHTCIFAKLPWLMWQNGLYPTIYPEYFIEVVLKYG
jgi:hypothetical protein